MLWMLSLHLNLKFLIFAEKHVLRKSKPAVMLKLVDSEMEPSVLQDLVVMFKWSTEILPRLPANSSRVDPSAELLATPVIFQSTAMANRNGVLQMSSKLMVNSVIRKRDIG